MARKLVGRTKELKSLVKACGAPGAFVAALGVPGVGKSRLCIAMEEQLAESGVTNNCHLFVQQAQGNKRTPAM